MGKTPFVLNIAQNVAFKENKTTAIFSLEMSKEQLVNRLFSLESQVDSQSLRTGNLKDSDWEKLIESAGIIGKSNLIIDDTPGISISELRSKCRKYKLEHNLELIIIDYLQLMTGRVGGRSDWNSQFDMAAELYKVCKLSETGLMNLECGISRYCILDFLLHKNYDLCSKKCSARIELLRIVIFEKKAKKIVFLLGKYANIKNGRKVQNKK